MTRRRPLKKLLLSFATLAVAWIAFECAARFFVEPSPLCYGTLFGVSLPPVRLPPDRSQVPGPVTNRAGLAPDYPGPERVTMGDVAGILEADRDLGHVPAANARSVRGWWQSNNVGARRRTDTSRDVPPGRRRILVFGESFTNCSRVRQEETWPYLLERAMPTTEVVNFGVDAYGMGQAFLRYERVRDRIDFDECVLVFVPAPDLPRDINVYRYLAFDWRGFVVNPRFALVDGALERVANPFPDGVREADANALREHLRRHDAFWFPQHDDGPPLLGRSIAYKLVANKIAQMKRDTILNALARLEIDVDAEAVRLGIAIFRAMRDDVVRRGKRFTLVMLPFERTLDRARSHEGFRADWAALAKAIDDAGVTVIDLLPALSEIDPGDLDLAYDGCHYGPKSNARIASLLRERLCAPTK